MLGEGKSACPLAKLFTWPKARTLALVAGALAALLLLTGPAVAQKATTTTSAATTTTERAAVISAPASTTTTTAASTAGSGTDITTQCLTCHQEEYLGSVQDSTGKKNLYIDGAAYKASAHGFLPCNSCHINFSHNPHEMVKNAEFFAKTAGEACRNCHDNEFEMYKQSYHGKLTKGGSVQGTAAPVCVDCHGAHAVKQVKSLAYRRELQDICGRCHGGRESTFLDTYHGKAITLGRDAAATCVDCHGSHSILPVADPKSTLSQANILPTCQKCHPTAQKGFTTFLVHISPTSPKAPLIVFGVAAFYLTMIVAVFIFGGTHTLLYIFRGLKDGHYFKKGGH